MVEDEKYAKLEDFKLSGDKTRWAYAKTKYTCIALFEVKAQ